MRKVLSRHSNSSTSVSPEGKEITMKKGQFRCMSCDKVTGAGRYIPEPVFFDDGDPEVSVKVCVKCAKGAK